MAASIESPGDRDIVSPFGTSFLESFESAIAQDPALRCLFAGKQRDLWAPLLHASTLGQLITDHACAARDS